MSSTISIVEKLTIPKRIMSEIKDEKRLVRASSIDKIKQFNTYLCTQHYYIIPAILAWLKSSQDVLHVSAEKMILNFRFLILNTIFNRLVQLDYKAISYRNILEQFTSVITSFKSHVAHIYYANRLDIKFLTCLVYLTGLILFAQLTVCLFVIFTSEAPPGLLFLTMCVFYIIIMYYKATFFFMANKMNPVKLKKQK